MQLQTLPAFFSAAPCAVPPAEYPNPFPAPRLPKRTDREQNQNGTALHAETARLGSSQKQPCLSPKREPPAAIWQMKTKADKQYAKADQRRSVPILIRHTKPAQRRLRAT